MILKIILNNALWSALSHIFSRGTLMLSSMLLAKKFSPEIFAVYSYFQMTVTMIATYAALGMGFASSKFFAQYSIDRKNVEVLEKIKLLFTCGTVFSLFIFFIILILPNGLVSSGLPISNISIALAILLVALTVIPNGAILGLEKYKTSTVLSFIAGVVCLIGVYFSIKYNRINFSIIFFILAYLIQFLGQFFVVKKYSKGLKILSFSSITKKRLKELFQIVAPLFAISIISVGNGWFIGLILLKKYGEFIFSIYSIGLQWFSLALFLPGMISRVILPQMIKGEGEENKNIIIISSVLSILISILIFITCYFLRNKFVAFYGVDYEGYTYFLVCFLAVSIIYAPINVLGNAILTKLNTIYWFIIIMLSSMFLFLILFFTIKYLGLFSVILSYSLSAFFMLLSSFVLCKKMKIL